MSKKKPFAVIDTETDPFLAGRVPEPFCAGFYDGNDYFDYWGDDCIQYLCEDLADYDGYVYAHNGGKFDFHFMLDYINPGSIKIINGRIAEMKIGKATLRDSYLILPVPLSAHEKTKIDYSIFEREERDENKREILDYLGDDCRSLYGFITAFFDRFPRRLTLPGIAVQEIEKACGKIERLDKTHDTKFRPFYYGGRVECFESGKITGDLKLIDINSAYPDVMTKDHAHGAEYRVATRIPTNETKRLCSFYHFIGASRGAVPQRNNKGAIIFGDTAGEYKITGRELMAGLDTGTLDIHQMIAVYVPKKTINFSAFVEKYYAEKLGAEIAGDKTGRLFAKLIMNSGYGKLGANPEKYCDYEVGEPGVTRVFIQAGYSLELTEFGPFWLWSRPIDSDSPQARYFDVATAASITGAVRAFMWRSINSVSRPIYCDTDSILCADTGNLQMGDALGQWSVDARVSEAHIAGKKLYAMETLDGWKTASKGVRASADQIIKAAAGENVTVIRDTPTFSAKSVPKFQNRIIRNTAIIV